MGEKKKKKKGVFLAPRYKYKGLLLRLPAFPLVTRSYQKEYLMPHAKKKRHRFPPSLNVHFPGLIHHTYHQNHTYQ